MQQTVLTTRYQQRYEKKKIKSQANGRLILKPRLLMDGLLDYLRFALDYARMTSVGPLRAGLYWCSETRLGAAFSIGFFF